MKSEKMRATHSRFPLRNAPAFAFRCTSLFAIFGLAGCRAMVLDPRGAIGRGDSTILIDSLAIMLAIVIPTVAAVLLFAWRYRSSNANARYLPNFEYSGQVEMITWSIPLLTIMLLGGVIWLGSHELDPAAPLPAAEAPLNVEVVSLDWKWLFIYPEQRIASVNKLVIPVGRPVHFSLTSATVMTAFFIPQLGSMIYTMNRMATQLNLNADEPGVYLGEASHFSGDGFSGMHFDVEAMPADSFSAWIDATRNASGPTLTSQSYQALEKQSMDVAPFFYRDSEPGIFEKIVTQALPPGPGPGAETSLNLSEHAEK